MDVLSEICLRFELEKPKLLENSKLALVCCSDEWRGWVRSNSPNIESCTSTSPFLRVNWEFSSNCRKNVATTKTESSF